ncbi:MAG: MBL fold metallo-hydrolase [Prevotella sp.]|nr:MBL fold metallo-hydrolase [Prevotella sp.]
MKYLLAPGGTYTGPLKTDSNQVSVLTPGEVYEDDILRVNAFGSTDIGNSYALEVDGIRLFHAGDLNAWVWKDESTPQEVEEALALYEEKLYEIHRKFHSFDVAMFPVDARIGRDYREGAFRFTHQFNISQFIPMHFCLYETDRQRIEYIRKATDFVRYANMDHGHYVVMTQPGQTLNLI